MRFNPRRARRAAGALPGARPGAPGRRRLSGFARPWNPQTRERQHAHGVKTSVSTVAMPRPKTTAVASCFHHSAVGLSTV
jgi:hypothetical protein